MNENSDAEIAIQNAMKEEQYFQNFYKEMADKAEDESMKEELLKLSEQEAMHYAKLEAFSYSNLGTIILPEDEIHTEHVGLPPIEGFLDLESMFEFAIKQEVHAKLLYAKLSDASSDEEIKEIFRKLSEEESSHEQILVERLKQLKK